jgi:PAS domain S-box-containing protein
VAGVITQQMSIGIVMQSSTGSIIEANAAAERILGLTRDQMMGRTSIDPRWRSVRADGTAFPGHIHPSMRAIREGGVQRDLMGVHKPDGTMTWIDIEARRLVETADSAVFASFVDVTAVRVSEAGLTAALQRQDMLTLLSSEAVLTVDASFTVTSASGTAGRLLGFGEAAVIGQRLPSWSADEGHWRSIERALGELLAYPGARGRWDFVLKLGTGHTRTFECSGMNMFADPTIRGIVLNLRDIHDQRMAEAAVRAANEQLERQVQEMKADRAFDASLSRVADLLQHCTTVAEAQDVMWASLPNLLPGFRLGLYFASEGQTDFFRHRPGPGDSAFLMIDGCWALRTRRTHISDQGVIMRCDHAAGEAGPMACLPLVLGGLPLGLISMRTELGGPPLPPRDDLERLAVRLSMVAGNSPLRGEPPPT